MLIYNKFVILESNNSIKHVIAFYARNQSHIKMIILNFSSRHFLSSA